MTGQEEAEGNPGQKQVKTSHHEMKMDKKAGIRGEGEEAEEGREGLWHWEASRNPRRGLTSP